MSLLELARQHRKAGRLIEAAEVLRDAVAQSPMDPELWFQGGTLAIKLKDFAFARSLFDMVARVAQGDAEARYNLGYCAFRLGDPEAALGAYEQAVALDPTFLRAQIARGQLLYILGRPDEGRAAFDAALALPRPNQAIDLELRALIRVVRGEFTEGWAEFDTSWSLARRRRLGTTRTWDGHPDPSLTVCLTVDGGFGDTVLFARFAEQVRRRVGRVVASVEPALAPLVEGVAGIDALIQNESDLAPGAQIAGWWTLPRKLGTTATTIPTHTPYLPLPDAGPSLGRSDRLRVGIAWFGGRDCAHDFDRSCQDPSHLAPLFDIPGIEWHLLQPSIDVAALPIPSGAKARMQPLPAVRHFGDTGFILRQLDLVITVDTAVSNLSAALGVPTWIMIPTIPEFRWPIGAERSPWYPLARLFRRAHTRDWNTVALAVARALEQRVNAEVDLDLPAYRRLECW